MDLLPKARVSYKMVGVMVAVVFQNLKNNFKMIIKCGKVIFILNLVLKDFG